MDLNKIIRNVPDFPKPGIQFKDITTLLSDPAALRFTIEALAKKFSGEKIDVIAGIESRGFIFGTPLATHLSVGFIPIRKPGKLPSAIHRVSYALEYGQDSLEIHQDAVKPGQRVLIIDDLLATGGTAQAATQLIEKCGGTVVGLGFVIELAFLRGRERLSPHKVISLLDVKD